MMESLTRGSSDNRAALVAVLTATLMIAQQVAGKATRDTLFLTYFDIAHLPHLLVVSAVVSFCGVLVMSALLSRHGPLPLIPLAFANSAMLFLVEWAISARYPAVVAVVLYLHMALFGAVLISGFWSVVNERFDPRTAKSSVTRIAAAATLGGVLGGAISSQVTASMAVENMLIVLALMHAGCAIGISLVGVTGGRSRRGRQGAAGGMLAGLRIIRQTPFLRAMALLAASTALASALLDYALKAAAVSELGDAGELAGFFGTYYAVIGVVTFLLQGLLGPWVVANLGLAGSIASLPLAVILGGGAALALPSLGIVTLLRGTDSVLTNSFYRSGFELLYAPLRPDLKRPSKTIIDVASTRLGDLLGGGLLILILFLVPNAPPSLTISVAMLVMALALLATLALHRTYVQELARSLSSADVDADSVEGALLKSTAPDHERAFLLSRMSSASGLALEDAEDDPLEPLSGIEAEAAALQDLRTGQAAAIRRALANPGFGPIHAPALIPLITHAEVGDDIRMELRWMAPRIVGLLTDALLDADTDVLVRRQLPAVFEILHMPRAVDALVAGLADRDFAVRYKCARVLGRMTGRNPDLRARQEEVWEAVRLALGRVVPTSDHADEQLLQTGEAITADFDDLDPNLAYVFTLLLLVIDREAVALSVRAITGQDTVLRGTALEYLENVLPEDVRIRLWEQLRVSGAHVPSGRLRSREAMLDALVSSADRLRPKSPS